MSEFNETESELPMVECPHCGCDFRWREPHCISVGSEQQCQWCDAPVHVVGVEKIMRVRLATEPEEGE